MVRTNVVSFVLFAAIVLCILYGQKHIAPWIFEDKLICCKEHPSVERCLPGIDDDAEKDGKCWKFCIEGCETGGFCKLGHKHICHCNCSG
ncbi:Defensin-like protein 20-27 [Arabidopsis suecica]|uniref:Defensin-like protein 20-27 n=1 Tax=Arabidopsis suecica TaxID=45249 RepID=A0A8T2DKZ4_ARASU|nr:Defensin-like protein 20-27 [Arabidopsis suecica]